MNIVVLHENISAALSRASKFLPSKTSTVSPVNNLYMSAENGVISLQATDLETAYKTTIPGKVEGDGKILLPAKTAISLISSFSGEKIRLKTERGSVVVSGASSEAHLRLESSDLYPVIEASESIKRLSLPAGILQQIVVKNGFVVSSDPARPALTGVLFSVKNNRLTTVSTDGFRLSVLVNNALTSSWEDELILPGKAVRAFLDVQKEGVGTEMIYDESDARISVRSENEEVVTRLIEGQFPTYEKIIPGGYQTKITVDRVELLRAVKLASVFAREAANIVKLRITRSDLFVSARAAQTGDNVTTVSIQQDGEELETAFNYRYLQDIVSALDSETVTFESNGPLQAGVFYGESKESFFHIIMPVRLQDSP